MFRTLNLFFLCSLSLLLSPLAQAYSPAAGIKGALCVIRADHKLVLIHEVITNKISLPGGTIQEGEPPELAAQRETWEETGLVVTVGDELGRTDSAVLFDCVSDSEIIAYSVNNSLGGNELPVWFAPHYGIEVKSAMLLYPQELSPQQYRYPGQWRTVEEIFAVATEQPVAYVAELTGSAPSYRQLELTWIVRLQSWVKSFSPQVQQGVHFAANLIDGLTSASMLLLLFPVALARFGLSFVYRLFFAVTVTSLMVLIAQQGFALPRPHVYVSLGNLTDSYGYNLPSLPLALWFCIATFIFHRSKTFGINQITATITALVMLIMLSKLYLGAAFLLDMLVGAMLGALVAWHILRLEAKPEVNVDQLMKSKGVWFFLTAATAVVMLFWPLPVFTRWLAILITASALVISTNQCMAEFSSRHMQISVVVLVFVDQLYRYVASVSTSSGFWSLVIQTFHYPLLMLVFMLLARRLTEASRQQIDALD
ncbi:phosphatase PAP2 family protein [Vibrio sp. CAU 1672]|uniref:NUDIX domain-containing protein n=1 Tax=Vibrio sp. CAU 1672 TaxID=3032594 RepID=UPI0023DB9BF4|nr:phosphatase PAP2 family protein [Vibrio sp. CAU 1672]MDF2152249.1 NUDIX domain-containing protein [Vibrio sp. CAU 1672]